MRAEINVTPLVDVVLVLLIIFMVITPMIVRGVSVDLPITSHHDRKNDDNKDLIVSINASGDVYVNADKVPIEKLTAAVAGRAAPLPRQGGVPEGRPPHPLRDRPRRRWRRSTAPASRTSRSAPTNRSPSRQSGRAR